MKQSECVPETLEEYRETRRRVRATIAALESGDDMACVDGFAWCVERWAIDSFARAIKPHHRASGPLSEWFVEMWLDGGDTLRGRIENDLDLIILLRALLPKPRIKKPMTIYRGESFQSRTRRTYGYSWTAVKRVGRAYAEARAKTHKDGAVLLRTVAPPDAILFSNLGKPDRFIVREVIIDRRRLGKVEVLERYPYSTVNL